MRRAFALVLAGVLLVPSPALARVVARSPVIPRLAPPAPNVSRPAPILSARTVPAPPVAPAMSAPSLAPALAAAGVLAEALPDLAPGDAPAAGERSFALLTGETPLYRTGAAPVAAPASADLPPLAPSGDPRRPDREESVKRMMLGTAAMKAGMESVTLGVPLLALQALGGASTVAALIVAYGLAQAASAGLASSLSERFTARKVLAGAVSAQAGLVAGVLALGSAGALTAATLLPLYLLVGAAVGVAETSRHSIPALILGRDGPALSRYNARLHIAYQVSGVAAALAAGAVIATAGPLAALMIQPPAYALAAWYFWRVRHQQPSQEGPVAFKQPHVALAAQVRAYFADAKAGAKLVLGDPRLRWIAAAAVLPQIIHRVFEGMLLPLFAKGVLERPEASAWLLSASNAGELIGAAVLLKLAAAVPGPGRWVAAGAAGLLLIGAFSVTGSLALLLPLTLVSSLTWSASDLSLRSEVQKRVPVANQARVISFMFSAFVLGSSAASFALGAFVDAAGVGAALAWIAGAIALSAAGVWRASRKV